MYAYVYVHEHVYVYEHVCVYVYLYVPVRVPCVYESYQFKSTRLAALVSSMPCQQMCNPHVLP